MKIIKTKKLFALITAIALIVSLSGSLTALAASNDPNFTKAPGTDYTTVLNSNNGYTANIAAGPADTYYTFSGFDDEEDAENVIWTTNFGDSAQIAAQAEVEISEGVWASQVTVERVGTNYGPTSFRATSGFTSASMDLTVVVENPTPEAPITVVVYIQATQDASGNPVNYYVGNLAGSTVPATANNVLTGADGVAQSYHTPESALMELVKAPPTSALDAYTHINALTFGWDWQKNQTDYAYINGFTFYNFPSLTTTAIDAGTSSPWPGWQYRVYDALTGDLETQSEVTGAAVYKLADYDVVYWQYGPYGSVTFPENIYE